jgi:uncharacterized membrane protein
MPAMRVPALGLLWPGLVLAYLACATLGRIPAALAVLGLMAGTHIAASGRPFSGLVAGVALAAAGWIFADVLPFLAYLPPLAAFAFMAWLFGRTLREGSEPLIARVARKEHPELPPDVVRHARRLTALWTACFLSLFIDSLVLAPFLSFEAWSRWVQATGVLAPGLLFFGEFTYRHYRFPDRTQGSVSELVTNVVAVFRELETEPGRRAAQGGETR